MGSDAGIVVVGGGIAGLAAAYHLAVRGCRDVVVLERDYLGGGSSTRNTARITAVRWKSAEMTALARENILAFARLSRELGWNVLFRQTGDLSLVHTEEEAETVRRTLMPMQRSVGVRTEFLDRRRVGRLLPSLRLDGVVGGLLHRGSGHVHHDAVIYGFLAALRRLGVGLRPGVAVERVLVAGGRVHGVATPEGEIAAGVVVNAAGARAPELMAPLGVRLAIVRRRQEALVTESMAPFLPVVLRWGRPRRGSLHQTLRGELVVTIGTAPGPDGQAFRQDSTIAFVRDCSAILLGMFPRLHGLKVVRQWAGLLTDTPDQLPIAGPTPGIEGLYQLNGLTGFACGPALGRMIAELIVSGRADPMLRWLRVDRFAERPAASG